MFSRQIPDGDTLLAGEMAGVDDGLVIQELSRPEELEKLQHELAKQVSKLAELGELKWLERLEAIETEELQEMKERLRLKARRAEQELRTLAEKEKNGRAAEINKLKKQEEEKIKALEWLGEKLEEIGKLQSAEEIKELRELSILGLLEEKKLEELKTVRQVTAPILGTELQKKLRELKEELKKAGGAGGLIKELKELAEKSGVNAGQVGLVKNLKNKLEELAAIRELKTNPELAELRLGALSLEEQLRTLAEVKEVKALVESRKDRELEIQEGLQLTERMGKLNGRLVRLAAQKLEEIKELTLLEARKTRPESNPQSIRKAASMLEEISVLRELRQLDELIPEEQLRTLAEVKDTIAQLEAQKLENRKVLEKIESEKKLKGAELGEHLTKWLLHKFGVEGKTLEMIKREWENKLEGLKELVLGRGIKDLGGLEIAIKGKLDAVHKLETLEELKNLKNKLARIKALEELTEIAEKRGVATTLKAALANAMETQEGSSR
ncbi:hypothetical protein GH714_043030 [Hevea brasiliensis]|uniref:Major surface protein 3 n=2 Tax=cellular organisms TaxID=131567 RepID=A0A6A6K2B3_HEVBR|nr:hypothetical protein GH714_043030 [Hevea brasiliensis]